jgi:hypothetical protein
VPFTLNTNVLVTVAQVLPVFLLAVAFEAMAFPGRLSAATWVRRVNVTVAALNIVLLSGLEFLTVACIGIDDPDRLSGLEFPVFMIFGCAIFFAISTIILSVIGRSADRRKAAQRAKMETLAGAILLRRSHMARYAARPKQDSLRSRPRMMSGNAHTARTLKRKLPSAAAQ